MSDPRKQTSWTILLVTGVLLSLVAVLTLLPLRRCPACDGVGSRMHTTGKYPGTRICAWCDGRGRISTATRWEYRETFGLWGDLGPSGF